jgi:hypothetical protein
MAVIIHQLVADGVGKVRKRKSGILPQVMRQPAAALRLRPASSVTSLPSHGFTFVVGEEGAKWDVEHPHSGVCSFARRRARELHKHCSDLPTLPYRIDPRWLG